MREKLFENVGNNRFRLITEDDAQDYNANNPEFQEKDRDQFRKDRSNSPEGEEVRKSLGIDETMNLPVNPKAVILYDPRLGLQKIATNVSKKLDVEVGANEATFQRLAKGLPFTYHPDDVHKDPMYQSQA